MRFKNFMSEGKEKGTYAGVKLSKESNKIISEYAKGLGFPDPIAENDIHVTLLYSKKYVPNLKLRDEISEPCTASGFEVFKTFDKKECLVLKLDCPYLMERHNELMDKYDATYDYPEYKPHITLCYDLKGMKVPKFVPMKPLTLEKEYEEDLKLEWKPK